MKYDEEKIQDALGLLTPWKIRLSYEIFLDYNTRNRPFNNTVHVDYINRQVDAVLRKYFKQIYYIEAHQKWNSGLQFRKSSPRSSSSFPCLSMFIIFQIKLPYNKNGDEIDTVLVPLKKEIINKIHGITRVQTWVDEMKDLNSL